MTQDDAPHLLHARADGGRARSPARVRASAAARPSGFDDFDAELSTAAREVVGDRRGVGRGHRGAPARARDRRTSSSWSTRAAARSTARRSTSHVRDAIGRTLADVDASRSTSNDPERFDLEYVGADNQRHRPVMIHRALFGSSSGSSACSSSTTPARFPAWLAPVQVACCRCARRPRRVRAIASPTVCGPRASGPTGSRPTSRSAPASARRSSRRCPTCSSSATTTSRDGTVGVNPRGGEVGARRARRRLRSIELRAERRIARSAVTLDRLWAGVAVGYVVEVHRRADDRGPGRVFTRILATGAPDEETHVSGEGADLRHPERVPLRQRPPLVMPYREVADLEDLGDDEHSRAVVDRRAMPSSRSRPPTARTASTSGSTSATPRGPACLGTCTCTACRGGRRHELHDGRRRDACPPREPRRELAQAHRGLADPGTPTPSELSCKVRHIWRFLQQRTGRSRR